jgi:pyruvate-ferredoxin/flavodoxin oxidoreductase
MKQFVGDPNGEHRLRNLMDPAHPIMSGVVQNQDSYMKGKIAQRYFYDRIPAIMKRVLDKFYSLTGRRYGMINGYELGDAEYAIVGLGSLIETATATAKYLRRQEGIKVGTLHITSFRPFPGPEIVNALKHVKAVAVVERMDNPTAQSNPLTAEIKAAFADAMSGVQGYPALDHIPAIYSGPRDWAAATFARGISWRSSITCARGKSNGSLSWAFSTPWPSPPSRSPMCAPKGLSRCAVIPSAATDL